jgi:hypothetical protein
MNKEHIISDEATDEIQLALMKNENWLAYNTVPYFLERGDMYFFKDQDEANEFAANNISDSDSFKVIYFGSFADVLRQIPYGENLSLHNRIDPDANPLQDKDGNAFTDSLIEHWENEQIKSSQKRNIMDEKAFGFNETQLKRSGFAEAFTPDLQQKMKEGVPMIQHTFKKQYDADQVEATLHLKKSATSDFYFLNKFDLHLQKEGQADPVKQTFYITSKKQAEDDESNQQKAKHENRYTLKEAYNLLAGRPVYKHLVNKDGEEYDAWVKINFKNKLENGNHEMKQYTKNYGFDLESVLSKYPIKELGNDQYKQSLIDSLHRGNMQKATFVGEGGKEEKLYVSPNITFGALHIYDSNKQRIPIDILVEKQYIGKEFAESLKIRASQLQKPEQTQKQEQPQSQKQDLNQAQKQEPTQSLKQEQKQTKKQKQKNDEPAKKHSRKQKMH